jgi:hypothetical protein
MIGSDPLSAQNGGASADSVRDGHRDPTRHGDTFQVNNWFLCVSHGFDSARRCHHILRCSFVPVQNTHSVLWHEYILMQI